MPTKNIGHICWLQKKSERHRFVSPYTQCYLASSRWWFCCAYLPVSTLYLHHEVEFRKTMLFSLGIMLLKPSPSPFWIDTQKLWFLAGFCLLTLMLNFKMEKMMQELLTIVQLGLKPLARSCTGWFFLVSFIFAEDEPVQKKNKLVVSWIFFRLHVKIVEFILKMYPP